MIGQANITTMKMQDDDFRCVLWIDTRPSICESLPPQVQVTARTGRSLLLIHSEDSIHNI